MDQEPNEVHRPLRPPRFMMIPFSSAVAITIQSAACATLRAAERVQAALRIVALHILCWCACLLFSEAAASERVGLGTSLRSFQENIQRVQELGVGAVRVNLPWGFIEPRPGQFEWTQIDRVVDAAGKKNVEVLFTLTTVSPWGTRQPSRATGIYHSASAPLDLAPWKRFVETLALRYRGRGVHYEIGNEVNASAFWTGTLDEYLDLLKASYESIKRANPRALVLPSAMACGIVRNFSTAEANDPVRARHDDWLRPILAARAFDVVAVHDYYFPSGLVVNGYTFRGYLEHIRTLRREAGVGERPIWITEAGYVSRTTTASGRTDPGSYENQAKWLTQAYEQAFQSGVERVFWLLLRDREEVYFGSMGLADTRGNPRPAWDALKRISDLSIAR